MEDKVKKLNDDIESLKKEIFEERVKREANHKIFFVIAAVLLAILGYTNFVKMPSEVDKQLTLRVENEVARKLKEMGADIVRKKLNELLVIARSDIDIIDGYKNKSSQLKSRIEAELNSLPELPKKVENLEKSLGEIDPKLSMLSFDKNSNLILPKGLKIPYTSGLSITNIPSWKDGEFRILTTGWEENKGDYLRFFVPGNKNRKGHIFAIYDTGKIEVNGKKAF